MENFSLVKVKWSIHRERLKPIIDDIGLKANDLKLYTNIDKACSNEWAFLFLASDGFIVLRPRLQFDTSYIEITVAYCHGGNAPLRYQSSIIKLALQGNAKFIEFLTVRKGVERVAPAYGWFKEGTHKNLAIWRYYL